MIILLLTHYFGLYQENACTDINYIAGFPQALEIMENLENH